MCLIQNSKNIIFTRFYMSNLNWYDCLEEREEITRSIALFSFRWHYLIGHFWNAEMCPSWDLDLGKLTRSRKTTHSYTQVNLLLTSIQTTGEFTTAPAPGFRSKLINNKTNPTTKPPQNGTVQQRSALITCTKLLIAKAKLEKQSATIVERKENVAGSLWPSHWSKVIWRITWMVQFHLQLQNTFCTVTVGRTACNRILNSLHVPFEQYCLLH